MSDKELDAKQIEEKVHNLAESMERMKSAQADKDDVVVDMKHAKHTRLELLAEDLLPVLNDVPADNDQFDFALTSGETPRLWIDMTAFVRMGADQREYEFVMDTRLGRVILARSANREEVGRRVTDYVAERILLRERVLEGDWISTRTAADHGNGNVFRRKSGHSRLTVLLWFLGGIVGGAIILTLLAWNGQLASLVNWLA